MKQGLPRGLVASLLLLGGCGTPTPDVDSASVVGPGVSDTGQANDEGVVDETTQIQENDGFSTGVADNIVDDEMTTPLSSSSLENDNDNDNEELVYDKQGNAFYPLSQDELEVGPAGCPVAFEFPEGSKLITIEEYDFCLAYPSGTILLGPMLSGGSVPIQKDMVENLVSSFRFTPGATHEKGIFLEQIHIHQDFFPSQLSYIFPEHVVGEPYVSCRGLLSFERLNCESNDSEIVSLLQELILKDWTGNHVDSSNATLSISMVGGRRYAVSQFRVAGQEVHRKYYSVVGSGSLLVNGYSWPGFYDVESTDLKKRSDKLLSESLRYY